VGMLGGPQPCPMDFNPTGQLLDVAEPSLWTAERIEHLCRDVARPPLSTERLSLSHDGKVVYRLRRHWTDGTAAIAFDPLTFIERLPWAELLKRVFVIDALTCRWCGGPRKLIALLTDGLVVRRFPRARLRLVATTDTSDAVQHGPVHGSAASTPTAGSARAPLGASPPTPEGLPDGPAWALPSNPAAGAAPPTPPRPTHGGLLVLSSGRAAVA